MRHALALRPLALRPLALVSAVLASLLAGCSGGALWEEGVQGETRGAGISSQIQRPKSRPDGLRAAPPPPQNARTPEQFDTTTQAERAAAVAAPAGGRALGSTIASLGTPSQTGFWLKTPLVQRIQPGRVVDAATGKSVQVTLIPIDGPATAGSRMSLAALRLIGAPLTGLLDIDVFADT